MNEPSKELAVAATRASLAIKGLPAGALRAEIYHIILTELAPVFDQLHLRAEQAEQKCAEYKDALEFIGCKTNHEGLPSDSADSCPICKEVDRVLSSTSSARPCQHPIKLVILLSDGHEWCSDCGALFRAGPGAQWELPRRKDS